MHRFTNLFMLLGMFVLICSSCLPSSDDDTLPLVENVTPAPLSNQASVPTISFGVQQPYQICYQPTIDRFNSENPDMRVVMVDTNDILMSRRNGGNFDLKTFEAADKELAQ